VKITKQPDTNEITRLSDMKKGVLYEDKDGDIWMIAFSSSTHQGGYICLPSGNDNEPFMVSTIERCYMPLVPFTGTISND